jgi:uncharacterized BrkB/YihY/UPF0761 family membrane protein
MSDQLDDYDDAPAGRRVEPHRGVMILVFGILGLMVCFIFGIVAWVMGKGDLQKMKSGQMDREGEALTRVGYILGIVSTVIVLAAFVIWLLIVVLAVGAGAARG